jgi:hypothetical protein
MRTATPFRRSSGPSSARLGCAAAAYPQQLLRKARRDAGDLRRHGMAAGRLHGSGASVSAGGQRGVAGDARRRPRRRPAWHRRMRPHHVWDPACGHRPGLRRSHRGPGVQARSGGDGGVPFPRRRDRTIRHGAPRGCRFLAHRQDRRCGGMGRGRAPGWPRDRHQARGRWRGRDTCCRCCRAPKTRGVTGRSSAPAAALREIGPAQLGRTRGRRHPCRTHRHVAGSATGLGYETAFDLL